jgi:hypothetical protein
MQIIVVCLDGHAITQDLQQAIGFINDMTLCVVVRDHDHLGDMTGQWVMTPHEYLNWVKDGIQTVNCSSCGMRHHYDSECADGYIPSLATRDIVGPEDSERTLTLSFCQCGAVVNIVVVDGKGGSSYIADTRPV